jgi:hypothetical protein
MLAWLLHCSSVQAACMSRQPGGMKVLSKVSTGRVREVQALHASVHLTAHSCICAMQIKEAVLLSPIVSSAIKSISAAMPRKPTSEGFRAETQVIKASRVLTKLIASHDCLDCCEQQWQGLASLCTAVEGLQRRSSRVTTVAAPISAFTAAVQEPQQGTAAASIRHSRSSSSSSSSSCGRRSLSTGPVRTAG